MNRILILLLLVSPMFLALECAEEIGPINPGIDTSKNYLETTINGTETIEFLTNDIIVTEEDRGSYRLITIIAEMFATVDQEDKFFNLVFKVYDQKNGEMIYHFGANSAECIFEISDSSPVKTFYDFSPTGTIEFVYDGGIRYSGLFNVTVGNRALTNQSITLGNGEFNYNIPQIIADR